MVRGRMLSKKISRDERVGALSVHAAFLYTWIIPHLDCEGRIYADYWTMKSIVTFFDDFTKEKIAACINEWVTAGLVTYYGEKLKILQFNGFFKNQHIRKDREGASEIPAPPLHSAVTIHQSEITSTTLFSGSNQIKSNKPIEHSVTECSSNEEHFNELWREYPRPLGRKGALVHFKASVKTPQDLADIKQALINYKTLVKGKEEQYIQHGKTWFNNWRDYVSIKKPQPQY